MSRLVESGKIEEIIYARLEPGEDLLKALWEICVEKDIRTGVILEGSGALRNFRCQRFPRNSKSCKTVIDIVDYEGPLEANVQGIIGRCYLEKGMGLPDLVPIVPGVLEEDSDRWNMMGYQDPGGTGAPYIHAHMCVTNKDVTVLGHLMTGTFIESVGQKHNVPSHFTVVIAKMSGIEFTQRIDNIGIYHDIVKL